jgi:hypothetical protein
MIARDTPFVETLRAVISLAERLEPGSIAGATIVDRAERSLEMAVFGSVDRAFSDAIAGVPLGPPHVGTCAQALYRGEVVTSEDLATDTRFAKEWVQLCEDHGISARRSKLAASRNSSLPPHRPAADWQSTAHLPNASTIEPTALQRDRKRHRSFRGRQDRGCDLDRLAEASWVRRQAPRVDRVAD